MADLANDLKPKRSLRQKIVQRRADGRRTRNANMANAYRARERAVRQCDAVMAPLRRVYGRS